MKFSLLLKKGFLAGFLVALGSIILSILSMILPPVGCCMCLVGFIPGVLAAYLVKKQHGTINSSEAATTGAIAGAVCSLFTVIIFVPLIIILGGFIGIAGFFTDDLSAATALGGTGIGLIVGSIIGGILAIVISGIINAVTGLLYVLIK